MSNSFFVRKGPGPDKIVIPEAKDFDLSNDDDILACGLERDSFAERNKKMFDMESGMGVPAGHNPIGVISERLEAHFSKREIAFLLSKSMLQNTMAMVEEIKKKHGK